MTTFPFSAIVGQEELRLALELVAVEPRLGGVLLFGDRGTAKSTSVRALAEVLPKIRVMAGCPYRCDPTDNHSVCPGVDLVSHSSAAFEEVAAQVVDLPLGATEDRVVGALDLEAALTRGERRFTPGLLAQAHRGFLYIDEVNLLPDHLVDVLLDVAASGVNVVERDGLSVRHPARFVLVGSGNPEEGELRPQLLDRFGLSLDVATPGDVPSRVEVVKRRLAFEADPRGFLQAYASDQAALTSRLAAARRRLAEVKVSDSVVERCAKVCLALGTDGLRGEITLVRAASAAASLDAEPEVTSRHIRMVALLALRHRLPRNGIDEGASGARIERALEQVLGS